MFAVVGLGNLGEKYYYTRHNIGFLAIDDLSKKYGEGIGKFKNKNKYLYQKITYNNNKILLVKPMTYVNLSGEAISAVLGYFGIKNDMLIILDDYYLPYGSIRLKSKGSSGGHNGLKSIEKVIGSNYWRLRAGIFNEEEKTPMEQFVLKEFSNHEKKSLPKLLGLLSEATLTAVCEGVEIAMTKFNKKSMIDN